VTHEALADAEIDPGRYPHTIQPFAACRFEFEGARYETRWRGPASYGILRREFDHYLLERARGAGADVQDGVRVTGVHPAGDRIRLVTSAGEFTASLVIGAGGHHCPVARALGEVSELEEVVVAQESETRRPTPDGSVADPGGHVPVLYVEPDLKGYGWVFPKKDVLNVGIGCVVGPTVDLRQRRHRLVEALRASGRLPPDLEPFRGHAYVVRRRAPRRLAGERFCLVGDAAGLARDLSGEGIGPAIRSGILAGRATAAWLGRGEPLESYTRAVVQRYGTGEPGWLSRQLGRLPDAVVRSGVRTILSIGSSRRRVVLGAVFGMREVPS
jgi:flavin-dependent dehydrogenase